MKILDKIIEQKQKLDQLKPYGAAIREFLDDLELKFIYHSNAISGSKFTLLETKSILDGKQTINNLFGVKLEVINQKSAIDYIIKLANDKADITPENLKYINWLISNNIDSYSGENHKNKNYGKYKDDMVTTEKMNDFFIWYNQNKCSYNPVEFAARIAIELNKIKPFIDNNGKTIRLIVNLELLKHEYPLTIIGINGTKLCHDALHKAYTTNDYGDYIDLFASYILRSFNKYFDIIAGRHWKDKNYEHEFVL